MAPQPDFTHAWFPTLAFDEWQLDGHRAWARSGEGALIVSASGPLELVQTGGSAGHELRLSGRDSIWVIRLGHASDLVKFAADHELKVQVDTDGTYRIEDTQYGTVSFHQSGVVTAEGRTLDPKEWTLKGDRTKLPISP
ncbi:hypothetical protein [Thalassospira lucentensis]|uniref:hypothetical protein n=1 Tax=Thalassospira lucentensis TaxID=168935 RepID=UPI003AA8CE33